MNEAPFFDTNIVIDWLRRLQPARDELARYPDHRISRVAWAEVLASEGAEARPTVQAMISRFEVVELDPTIAAAAVDIRHRTRIKLLDAFILATAQVHGALLITRNTKDFPAGTPGVRVPYTL